MRNNFTPKLVFILFALLVFSGKLLKAQTHNFNNVRLDSVFLHLSQEQNCKFAYDYELISQYRVTKIVKLNEIDIFLKDILSEYSLDYQHKNNVYIIVPVKKEKKKYKVVGVVKDKDTGETLPFAHVFDQYNDIFCIANQDGYFSIVDIEKDSLSLSISYVGYYPSLFNLSAAGNNTMKVFYLSSQKHQIAEVVIKTDNTDESSFQVNDQASLATLNTKSINSFPGMGESDALRLVQMMPGVKSTNESSADLIIRGGTMDQNLLLFDDFSLYHTDHFYGMISSLNPKAIKHIQVHKGGFDARYGGRINSVVNIVGKDGSKVKPSIDFGLNMLSANLAIETPILKKGALFIAGRRSYTDFVQTSLFNQLFENIENRENQDYSLVDTLGVVAEQEKPEFYFYDINAKLTYSITEKDNISVSYFQSEDKLTRDEAVYGSFFTDSDILNNKGLSFRWGRQWNEKFYTKFLVSNSEFLNDFVSVEEFEYDLNETITYKIQNTNKVKERSYKLNSEYKFVDNVSLDFGYELANHDISYLLKYSYDDFEDIGANIANKGYLHAAYLQANIRDIKRFGITCGLRSNYYNKTEKMYFEPRIKLNYKLHNNFVIKSAYGIYHQYLARVFTGDEYSTSKSLWFTSDNVDIPISKSNQYIFGFQYNKNKIIIDVEYFKKDVDGLVKYVYDFIWNDYSSEEDYFTDGASFYSGKANIQGVDFFMAKDFGNLYTWFSYTLSENNHNYESLNNGKEFFSINDQRHEFKLAGVKSFKNLKITLSWIYGSGQVYSNPYEIIDNEGYIIDNKIPDYHKMDLNFTYDYSLAKLKGNVGISVLNLYNRKNRRVQESIPYLDNTTTYYDLSSIDLTGRAISAFFNIKF